MNAKTASSAMLPSLATMASVLCSAQVPADEGKGLRQESWLP